MMSGDNPERELEVYTDIGPVIKMLGLDLADKLATMLVQQERVVPENLSPARAKRFNKKPIGLAGFEIGPLFDAFENIIKNNKEIKQEEQPV